MRVWCRPYWAPKESCTDDEYEDAYAWWPRGRQERAVDDSFSFAAADGATAGAYAGRQLKGAIGDRFSFAAADGATASSYAGLWARQLALAFVTGKLRGDNLAEALPLLRKRWLKRTPKQSLAWWAEQSLDRGAFAALVGLTLEEDGTDAGTWSWKGLAVGDSCLVHMHENNVISFPLERADQFGTTPILLPTNPSAIEAAIAERRVISGPGVDGDRFYLMTDALAQWFLSELERGAEPWYALEDLVRDPDALPFREWLTGVRQTGRIRNDDVTLLRIEVE